VVRVRRGIDHVRVSFRAESPTPLALELRGQSLIY
jgi:hypothetical protein